MTFQDIRGMRSLAENAPMHSTAHHQHQQFLMKLPASIIKNGRIVDVRQSISNLTKV